MADKDGIQYHLETIPLRTATQVAEQIESAHQASRAWAKTTFAQRKMLLRSLKAWVLRDMEGIVQVACRDTGKTSQSVPSMSRSPYADS